MTDALACCTAALLRKEFQDSFGHLPKAEKECFDYNNVRESQEVLLINVSDNKCSLLEADYISKSHHSWVKIQRLQEKSILVSLEIHFLTTLAKTVTLKR